MRRANGLGSPSRRKPWIQLPDSSFFPPTHALPETTRPQLLNMTIAPTSNADLTQAKMDLPPHEHTGPQIKSYDRFLSEESKSRKPSPLKALAIK